MSLRARVEADHSNIVAVLAFLALDCPTFRDVIRSLVIELYGTRGVRIYDAHQGALSPAPPVAATSEKADRR
jgi:hypothetical protein